MKIKSWIELAIVVIGVYWVLNIFGIGCPIKYLTGVSCAGCGMTRAWLSVLRFDFSTAFYYHPLFLLPPIVIVGILFKGKIPTKVYSISMWLIILIFVAVYLYRLFGLDDTVVEINFFNGAIYKWIKVFWKGRWGKW